MRRADGGRLHGLVGDIQDPDLQRHFLELARQLTAAAESVPTPALATQSEAGRLPLAL